MLKIMQGKTFKNYYCVHFCYLRMPCQHELIEKFLRFSFVCRTESTCMRRIVFTTFVNCLFRVPDHPFRLGKAG